MEAVEGVGGVYPALRWQEKGMEEVDWIEVAKSRKKRRVWNVRVNVGFWGGFEVVFEVVGATTPDKGVRVNRAKSAKSRILTLIRPR